eukprot:scaffold120342_cov26-Tisochrysis_lutea.AAC.3
MHVRQPKVAQLDAAAAHLGDEQVLELQVTVRDAVRVHVGDGGNDSCEEARDDRLGHAPMRFDQPEEFAALARLHHEVRLAVDAAVLEQAHNVGVRRQRAVGQ